MTSTDRATVASAVQQSPGAAMVVPRDRGRRLVLVSSLPVVETGDGRVTLTRKFLTGIVAHQRLWPGPVEVIMEPEAKAGDNLDNVTLHRTELPFELKVLSTKSSEMAEVLRGAAMVLLILYHKQTHLAAVCAKANVPFVFTSEYTLRTRLQIARTATRNLVRLGVKSFLEIGRERRMRKAVARAAGMHCNGTPTYDAYRTLNTKALLFFDTRVEAGMIASDEVLARRFAARRSTGKIRLAFSGRLIAMKGADHLVLVADHLRATGRSFHLSICGAGALEGALKAEIAQRGLQDEVSLLGTLDFETELVPFIRDKVDVFVCCHRQGDPSCTYLETMACGVPIAGYDNEAFKGLASVSHAGWLTPMDDPAVLAKRIAMLSDDDIEEQSRRSLDFARGRTFQAEFGRRMAHLRGIAQVDAAQV